jgi:Leucine-rich repeat (LRR) protein
LPNLKRLYLVSNKISKIENLERLTQLEMLELGDNKIRRVENLEALTNLRQLFLGKNKIRDGGHAVFFLSPSGFVSFILRQVSPKN